MRTKLLTAAFAAVVTIGVALGASAQQKPATKSTAAPPSITVYKSPT